MKGDTIIECGMFSLIPFYNFSKNIGHEGKIIAFEPSITSYMSAMDFKKIFKIKNIIPLQYEIDNKLMNLIEEEKITDINLILCDAKYAYNSNLVLQVLNAYKCDFVFSTIDVSEKQVNKLLDNLKKINYKPVNLIDRYKVHTTYGK
jgi:hypothetical protein